MNFIVTKSDLKVTTHELRPVTTRGGQKMRMFKLPAPIIKGEVEFTCKDADFMFAQVFELNPGRILARSTSSTKLVTIGLTVDKFEIPTTAELMAFNDQKIQKEA